MRHLAQRGDGCGEPELTGEGVVFDEGEHDRGGTDLQKGLELRHVGVAHDHMESSILAGIGVRLVTGVDDRAFERRLQPDLLFEEIGSLGELVWDV